MDVEALLSESETEIKDNETDFRTAVNKLFTAIKSTDADLDTPINDLLNEMKIMTNSLIILRATRTLIKRELNEMRRINR